MRHIKFEEGDVLRLVKKYSKRDGQEKMELAVLLKTGSIYNNVLNLIDSDVNMELVSIKNRTF